jgi:hypothetical protein
MILCHCDMHVASVRAVNQYAHCCSLLISLYFLSRYIHVAVVLFLLLLFAAVQAMSTGMERRTSMRVIFADAKSVTFQCVLRLCLQCVPSRCATAATPMPVTFVEAIMFVHKQL